MRATIILGTMLALVAPAHANDKSEEIARFLRLDPAADAGTFSFGQTGQQDVQMPGYPQERNQDVITQQFRDKHGEFGKDARRFTPMIEASYMFLGHEKVNNEKGHFDLNYYKLDALVPIPIAEDTFVLAGAKFEARDYNFSNVQPVTPTDDTLYGVGPRIGLGHFVNDDLVVQGYWQPTINSDFDGSLKNEDWKWWYGSFLAVYRSEPDFFWKGGIVATDVVDSGVLPLLGFAWMFKPGWRFDVLLPRNVEVSFTPDDRWYFMGGIEGEGDEYRVEQTIGGVDRHFDVNVQEFRLYLGTLLRMDDHWSASLQTGTTIGGRYEWKSGIGERYDGGLDAALFVRAALGFTF